MPAVFEIAGWQRVLGKGPFDLAVYRSKLVPRPTRFSPSSETLPRLEPDELPRKNANDPQCALRPARDALEPHGRQTIRGGALTRGQRLEASLESSSSKTEPASREISQSANRNLPVGNRDLPVGNRKLRVGQSRERPVGKSLAGISQLVPRLPRPWISSPRAESPSNGGRVFRNVRRGLSPSDDSR